MTLRDQLLSELRQQDDIAQAKIKKLEEDISGEAFLISTLQDGVFAGVARNACQKRMEAASAEKDRIKQQNSWISEMLSKYDE